MSLADKFLVVLLAIGLVMFFSPFWLIGLNIAPSVGDPLLFGLLCSFITLSGCYVLAERDESPPDFLDNVKVSLRHYREMPLDFPSSSPSVQNSEPNRASQPQGSIHR